MPPYSSGICEQSMPASPALFHSWRSICPSFSHCAWKGTASCSRNLRTLSRKSSWSELNRVLGIMMAPCGEADYRDLDFNQANAWSHWTQAPINKTIQPANDHLALIRILTMLTQQSSPLRRVSILATEGVFASTLMQAKDFFHMASLRYGKQQGLGLTETFEIRLVSPDGQPVRSFSNVMIPVDGGLDATDVIILPAFWDDFDALRQRHPQVLRWLKHSHANGSAICGEATGVFWMAEAGLLDGKEATTYWRFFKEFAERFPKVLLSYTPGRIGFGGQKLHQDLTILQIQQWLEEHFEVLFQPLLDLQDGQVLVQLLPAKTDAPRGVAEQHFGKTFGELLEKAPVGGRFLAVEQAGLGHPEHAGGFATDRAAVGVAVFEPAEHLGMALAEGVEVVPEGRQDNHIGGVEAAVDRDHDVAEAAHRLAVRADQANLEGFGQTESLLLAVTQAGHVEEVLGLHQGRGKYPFGGENADAAQGR